MRIGPNIPGSLLCIKGIFVLDTLQFFVDCGPEWLWSWLHITRQDHHVTLYTLSEKGQIMLFMGCWYSPGPPHVNTFGLWPSRRHLCRLWPSLYKEQQCWWNLWAALSVWFPFLSRPQLACQATQISAIACDILPSVWWYFSANL